jgi:hypothetical protein
MLWSIFVVERCGDPRDYFDGSILLGMAFVDVLKAPAFLSI